MAEVSHLSIRIDADTAAAEGSLKALSQNVASFGDAFKSGLGIGAGFQVMQAGLSTLSTGFGAVKSSVIDFNQQLDASRAIFTRYFQGNEQVAESFLNTLKGFAATTPFEFKDLSTLAVRLQNANTNANDIIPTIKAIGNAASASGSLSQESLDRITLALTQMQMKGKVSGEEMLQLTEANVPAWNILAEATGKPVAQLQKMASQGEITADVFVDAFRKMYENAGLMDGASKSLSGALSTIRDVGTQALAEVGRSFYDLATQATNALAGFLSSDDFQTWVQAAKFGVDALVGGIQSFVAALQPVGAVIAEAFHQFTSGDFMGAFSTIGDALTGSLSAAVESVQSFAHQMFGAGATLVDELAGGIIEGASSVLTAAVNVVADTIAAFLIGNSPPPDGPLARIREGGANTIAAWGEGAASAADRAVKPAADKIAGNIGELKIAGRDAEASIREIGRAIQDVESSSRDLKWAADDIKDAYNDQIKALDDQIKALQNAHDVQRDREKLELNLEEAQLRQAEIAAMGDKTLRAQIQSRLEALKLSNQERKNREAMDDAEKALAGSEKDRLKAKLESRRLDQQEKDLRSKLKDAKGDDKKRIQSQLQELEIRRQIDAAEAAEREKANERRMKDAEAKKEELSLQQQLDGMVDKVALAEIKVRQEALRGRKDELAIMEQTERIQREIALLPLKEQREALIDERDALLKPLQEQLEVLGKQKAALGEQRQEMQSYKADIAAASAAIKDQEKAIKDAEKAAKEASQNAPRPALDRTFTPDAAAEAAIKRAKEAGEKLAGGLRDGFASMFDQIIPTSVRNAFDGIAARVRSDGIPGVIQVIGQGLASAVPVFASKLSAWLQQFLDWERETQLRLIAVMDELINAVMDWIESNAAPIADTLYEWTVSFVNWVTDTGPELLDTLADMGGNVLDWIGDWAIEIAGALVEWATAFVSWVGPKIPELLGELGEMVARMVEWMGTHLGDLLDALGKWAVEFVEWVGPKIPPLLAELGALLVKVTEWIATTALPAIAKKLAEWGLAIVEWVVPRIVPLLYELGKVLVAVSDWIVNEARPAIESKLAEWGLAFLKWVALDVLPNLGETLNQIRNGIYIWIGEQVLGMSQESSKLGAGMLDGIKQGLSDNWDALKSWINENIGSKLPEWMQKLLGIHSPSTVFAEIGENLVLGLIAGMERRKGELLDVAEALTNFQIGEKGDSGGKVREYIIKAAKDRGIDPSVALRIARHEGGEDDYMRIGKFETGWSFWPFQLHYGGPGYEAFGTDAGMGNDFTRKTGLLPGDWQAWDESIDFALDHARRHGWGAWYGREPAGVDEFEGIPGYARGGIAWTPQIATVAEREPEAIIPRSWFRNGGGDSTQTVRVVLEWPDGRQAGEIYVRGREDALRRGRIPAGALS